MSLQSYGLQLLSSLSQAGLVPGSSPLIPDDFVPVAKLTVTYGTKDVFAGKFFRASECKIEPTITIQTDTELESASYTLLLIDPDAPTPDDPKFAYWRHWILTGLSPSKGGATTESKSAVTPYLAPGPKDDSRPHRYLFLLFREPRGYDLTTNDVGGEEFVQRRSFRVADFVKSKGLELVSLDWMLCAGDGWVE
ncbi:PEBP-like protein [Pseudovirgaria hyperparasitica]|uniref:PEBP-like protein n=1 Tax=Pseudovirgaria hyperparasitica TaxID=470096 RepID=A0A6A6W3S5_9PEZI|nr:PEBP-like protein [Pseudovirgaria hyperparasitica]KAF2756590.1 PEBP-like protein [Pseudovirgaria hyperparasitica]